MFVLVSFPSCDLKYLSDSCRALKFHQALQARFLLQGVFLSATIRTLKMNTSVIDGFLKSSKWLLFLLYFLVILSYFSNEEQLADISVYLLLEYRLFDILWVFRLHLILPSVYSVVGGSACVSHGCLFMKEWQFCFSQNMTKTKKNLHSYFQKQDTVKNVNSKRKL